MEKPKFVVYASSDEVFVTLFKDEDKLLRQIKRDYKRDIDKFDRSVVSEDHVFVEVIGHINVNRDY